MLTPIEWHQRFQQQAQWTQALRVYLFKISKLDRASKVLEIGCGTGVILNEIQTENHGIDIDPERLSISKQISPNSQLVCADAYSLPYSHDSFDISFGHFVFLWLKEPKLALLEMARVTKRGGFIIAMAEPDYGGRIDYPNKFQELGSLQTKALTAQGADPYRGRELKSLFNEIGLQAIETGVIGGQWNSKPTDAEWESEWRVIESDLNDLISKAQLDGWKQQDREAWENESRVLFIPTFYAIGRVS